jgi:hypothetical protein
MPTLNIEGRKVKVDDSFLKLSPADQQATVEEIASQLGIKTASSQDAPVSGLFDQFRAGMESNTELPGQTIETFGKTAGSQGLQDSGKWLRDLTSAPDNFVSATGRFINPQQGDSYVDPIAGFGWGNLPGAAAEVAGQMTGDIAVRAGGAAIGGAVSGTPTAGAGAPVGAVVGGLAAPALLEFMRVAGPVAQQRAQNNGRDVPDWSDWEAAAATAGFSGLLNSIGIKSIGALNQGVKEVGKKTAGPVVKEAVTETAKKAGKEGLTEFGQSITEQTGSTLGTDKGLSIDLKQAVGEGILGAGAGGMIDAGRNIRPTVSAVNDIRSVDSSIQNDPFARDRAEITQNINDIANGPARDSRELAPREITKMVDDLRSQAEEAIKGQNLSPQDKKALIKGLKNADGLSEERLNEIAGRSESPTEIQAIARKIQLVRSMTVQQQARKGVRGWAAAAARYGGGMAGAAVGQALGTGAVEGAAIGTGVGRVIAQKLSGSQSQGARINDLVGKKQARRAAMLLDRYGPSEATTALNTLTEKAAANKAQAEADAQAKADFEQTMSRIRYMNSMRQKSQRAMEQASSKEEKAKAAAEKQKFDLASREERLKAMAYRAQINKARTERLVQDLEQKKTLNALTVEMTKTRQELQQKMAEAKADKMDRDKQHAVKTLQGRLEMMAIDIARRNEALKKAEIATKRAQKMADKAPASAGPVLSRIRNMNSKWAQSVQEDANIANKPAYQSTVQYLDTLRQEAQNEIKAEPNENVRNLLRETLSDLMSLKNNWEARRERFARALRDAKDLGGNAPQKLRDTLYQLAHYKAPEGGREDFGTGPDTSQDPPF